MRRSNSNLLRQSLPLVELAYVVLRLGGSVAKPSSQPATLEKVTLAISLTLTQGAEELIPVSSPFVALIRDPEARPIPYPMLHRTKRLR